MTYRPSREHHLPVLAVALLAILPIHAARAQARSGASIATIDSAEIAGSGARTLSELLEARVAGLSVRAAAAAAPGDDRHTPRALTVPTHDR